LYFRALLAAKISLGDNDSLVVDLGSFFPQKLKYSPHNGSHYKFQRIDGFLVHPGKRKTIMSPEAGFVMAHDSTR